MELTRYDRERLGRLAGSVSLAGHAVPAFAFAGEFLSLPMEAGGLFFGPLLGLPLAFAGLMLLAGALLVHTDQMRQVPAGGLVLTLFADGFAVLSGAGVWWVWAGAALSAVSLAFFLSLLDVRAWGTTPRAADRSPQDQTVLVVAIMVLSGLCAVFVVKTGYAPLGF